MAEIVRASITWPGPRNDVLRIFVEPTPDDWLAEPRGADLALFRVPDEDDEPRGHLAGLEIVDFLDFDRWEDLPRMTVLWQLPGCEPLPLDELLKRKQQELRHRGLVTAKG